MSDILDLMTNKNRKKNQPWTRCDIKKMKPNLNTGKADLELMTRTESKLS